MDSEGSNPLLVCIQSSGNEQVGQYLIDKGLDGFQLNSQSRSPLSVSIEMSPTIAAALLDQKAQ